jgi:hypothetical protein
MLKYWCALNTTSPGQSRGRAGASLLTASPTVPACRPAYAAATCHWATRDRHTGARLLLCNIAHAHQLSTGLFCLWAGSTVAYRHPNRRAEPIARPLALIARGACIADLATGVTLPVQLSGSIWRSADGSRLTGNVTVSPTCGSSLCMNNYVPPFELVAAE